MRELSRPAVLLDVPVDEAGHTFADRLAVRHARTAHGDLQAVLAPDSLHGDLQMEFAHARQNGLAGFRVGPHGQRGVFLGQPGQRRGQPVGVGGAPGLHGHVHDRFGHARRAPGRAGRPARTGSSRRGRTPARPRRRCPRRPPAPAGSWRSARTRRMRPTRSVRRVPASPHGVSFSMVPEYTRRYVSRPVGVAFTLNAGAAIGAAGSAGRSCSVPSWVPRTGGTSSGGRQVGDDGVQQRFDAAGCGRPSRTAPPTPSPPRGQVAQASTRVAAVSASRSQNSLQRGRVAFRHRLLQQSAPVCCLLAQDAGHRPLLGRLRSVGPHPGRAWDQVDDAGEAVLGADGQLHDQGTGAAAHGSR